MKKALSRFFLLAFAIILIGSATDVYAGPGKPMWDEASITITPFPIIIDDCDDDDGQGDQSGN